MGGGLIYVKSILGLYESTFHCSSLKLSLVAVCELETLVLLSQDSDATLVILVQGMVPRCLSSFLPLKPFILKANLSP